MNNSQYLTIAERLMRVPTAPFREHWMCGELDSLLATIPGVKVRCDAFGNRIARLARGESVGAPVIFVAHLDHPGFVFDGDGPYRNGHDSTFHARFEGRVMTRFFPGAAVRFFRSRDDEGVPARIVEVSEDLPETGNRLVVFESGESIDGAVLGMWDLPAFRVGEDGFLRSRACDDLAGCAAMIEALRRLAESDDAPLDFTLIFTRAEEAGFCGLLCLIEDPDFASLVNPDALFLSVETSGEVGPVVAGEGAIIRCGDRSTTFDGALVDLLWGLTGAQEINARRALMDKGTCEATPLARAGLRAGGVCMPVRHYHNQDFSSGLIATEMVSVADAEALVAMIAALGRACGAGTQPRPIIPHDYTRYLMKGRAGLVPVPFAKQPA
ncbi:MAG: M20/M25/M40 family metallo-hydrolase [Candidatus Sumerlaeia bacterium]|nr:M20/M25/M40 family metallo-hydrolase [Candidatus Sumerlaeia bacterium]